jgi:hypothetical protein
MHLFGRSASHAELSLFFSQLVAQPVTACELHTVADVA